jgi:hypothetical protein
MDYWAQIWNEYLGRHCNNRYFWLNTTGHRVQDIPVGAAWKSMAEWQVEELTLKIHCECQFQTPTFTTWQ